MEDVEPLVPVIMWLLVVHHRYSEGQEQDCRELEGTSRLSQHHIRQSEHAITKKQHTHTCSVGKRLLFYKPDFGTSLTLHCKFANEQNKNKLPHVYIHVHVHSNHMCTVTTCAQ